MARESILSGGCTCGKCHWCIWETDPVEAIKLLIKGCEERDTRLEDENAKVRNFYAADRYKNRREGKHEILEWIERQQEADKRQELMNKHLSRDAGKIQVPSNETKEQDHGL